MDRNHHSHRSRPPDVEEALSSMLWTPYDCNVTPSDVQTSSDDEDEQLNRKLRETNNNRVSLATISPYVPFRKCDPKLVAAPFWGQRLLEPPSYESLYCGVRTTQLPSATGGDRLPVRSLRDRLPVLSSLKSLNNVNNNNYSGNVSVTNSNAYTASLLSPSSSSSSSAPRATVVAPRQTHQRQPEPNNLNRMVYSFSDNFIASDSTTTTSVGKVFHQPRRTTAADQQEIVKNVRRRLSKTNIESHQRFSSNFIDDPIENYDDDAAASASLNNNNNNNLNNNYNHNHHEVSKPLCDQLNNIFTNTTRGKQVSPTTKTKSKTTTNIVDSNDDDVDEPNGNGTSNSTAAILPLFIRGRESKAIRSSECGGNFKKRELSNSPTKILKLSDIFQSSTTIDVARLVSSSSDSANNCKVLSSSSPLSSSESYKADTSFDDRCRINKTMRLNVPGSESSVQQPQQPPTSTSSVFLTTNDTTTVTTTILVTSNNSNSNNNNGNPENNHNHNLVVANGVSVVNCSGRSDKSISVPNSVNNHNDSNDEEVQIEECDDDNNNNDESVNIVQKYKNNVISNQMDNSTSTSTSTSTPVSERTFTSTECQTEEVVQPRINRGDAYAVTREQRRRERRERRHLQQQHARSRHPHPNSPPLPQTVVHPLIHPSLHVHPRAMLPDILHHNNYPPPYSTLPINTPPPPPPTSSLMTPVISTMPITAAPPGGPMDGRFTIPLPIIRRSPSERSGKGCCGQWFAGPPLRALIAVVALGGVACALGGAALGATGLAGPPSSHLTAALLMIGVGVILVTVSGAAWRMTAPGGPPCLGLGTAVDFGRCGRRPCSRGGGAPHGLLYPEFQHRPPPPSYQASMQEYRLRLLLLDRDRQNGVVRGSSPPPTYRSHAGSLVRAPLTTAIRSNSNHVGGGGPGSEYSLPPSYRSRHHHHPNGNVNANTSSEDVVRRRSPIEKSESSESIASSTDQIPTMSSNLETHPVGMPSSSSHLSTRADIEIVSNSIPTTKEKSSSSTTICIQEEEGEQAAAASASSSSSAPSSQQQQHLNDKFNPRVLGSRNSFTYTTGCGNGKSSTSNENKDLVTIVTISTSTPNSSPSKANKDCNNESVSSTHPSELEILAHL